MVHGTQSTREQAIPFTVGYWVDLQDPVLLTRADPDGVTEFPRSITQPGPAVGVTLKNCTVQGEDLELVLLGLC